MKVVLPEAKSFASIIEALSKIVDEATLKFTSDKVILKALDPAKVSMFVMELPSSLFTEYDVSEEDRIGFNTSVILKFLKRAKKGESLEIMIEDSYAKFTIAGTYTRIYKILNLKISEEELPEPQLEFNALATILSDPLKHGIKDAETVGDTVEFIAETEEEFIIKGKGEASETETRISRESGALVALEVKEPSRSSYAIEYLKNIVALTKVADAVTIKFSSRMPVMLEFPIMGEGKVVYLLAPKVE